MHQATGNALSRLLQQEVSAIAAASERLNPGQVEAALAMLTSCAARRGKLVVSGVGKSGIAARKIAATFSSLSLTAFFLHPGDALHGDMDIVAADDCVPPHPQRGLQGRTTLKDLQQWKAAGSPPTALKRTGPIKGLLQQQASGPFLTLLQPSQSQFRLEAVMISKIA